MNFQVPQFIDIEDRIIGPLTLKQFGYLAIAFLLSFFSFFIFTFLIWVLITLLVAAISILFAFIRYNERPFSILFLSVVSFAFHKKKYRKNISGEEEGKKEIPQSHLGDLTLALETSTAPMKNERSFLKPFLDSLREEKDRYEILKKITGEKEVARRIDYR
ncbi:MAG: PrgI family protein [Candidatus Harrisonbacteria bacterium]|nr:PrgI family protein [Candidatus Harrisonbacteria bacterium]